MCLSLGVSSGTRLRESHRLRKGLSLLSLQEQKVGRREVVVGVRLEVAHDGLGIQAKIFRDHLEDLVVDAIHVRNRLRRRAIIT